MSYSHKDTLLSNFGSVTTNKKYSIIYGYMIKRNSASAEGQTTYFSCSDGTKMVDKNYADGYGGPRFILYVNVPKGTTIKTSVSGGTARDLECLVYGCY